MQTEPCWPFGRHFFSNHKWHKSICITKKNQLDRFRLVCDIFLKKILFILLNLSICNYSPQQWQIALTLKSYRLNYSQQPFHWPYIFLLSPSTITSKYVLYFPGANLFTALHACRLQPENALIQPGLKLSDRVNIRITFPLDNLSICVFMYSHFISLPFCFIVCVY